MAWCCQATSHYLNQCWSTCLSPYGVTRPLWVKSSLIPGEINKQKTETGDIERNISHMQNDMLKLNTLLHKERGTEHQLQQGTALMENDFIGALRVGDFCYYKFIA